MSATVHHLAARHTAFAPRRYHVQAIGLQTHRMIDTDVWAIDARDAQNQAFDLLGEIPARMHITAVDGARVGEHIDTEPTAPATLDDATRAGPAQAALAAQQTRRALQSARQQRSSSSVGLVWLAAAVLGAAFWLVLVPGVAGWVSAIVTRAAA